MFSVQKLPKFCEMMKHEDIVRVKEIAEIKKDDLNAHTIESAMRVIEGTARSAGITVQD